MTYEIYDCSQKASKRISPDARKNAAPTYVNTSVLRKYPIDELEIGKAFQIPIAECKEASLRVLISTRGKKDKKKFCLLKHGKYGVYEVARVG